MLRRAGALWLVLFAAYAATLGLPASGDSEYADDEPHHLLAAQSLAEDGDLDVLDDYRDRSYASFHPSRLAPEGETTSGRLHEPHAAGFTLLIAPAYAAGGARGVEVFLAALAALAGALAYGLARRLVPDPWALGAALAVGLAPPVLALSTAVYPEVAAAAALAGAALLALRASERPRGVELIACFALLAALPWLGPKYLPAALAVGALALRALWRQRRRLLAVGGLEVVAVSAFVHVRVTEALFGGLTPYAAEAGEASATGVSSPTDLAERAYRLVALLVDREFGLLRWAPVFALALLGAWLLYRDRREGLGRALPSHALAERTAALCGAAVLAQVLVAAFLAPGLFGFFFPARHLVAVLPLTVPFVAWGLRRTPRLGLALVALTLAASVWLVLDLHFGGGSLAAARPDAPWGPLEALLPSFREDSAAPVAVVAATALGVAALFGIDEASRRRRELPGTGDVR